MLKPPSPKSPPPVSIFRGTALPLAPGAVSLCDLGGGSSHRVGQRCWAGALVQPRGRGRSASLGAAGSGELGHPGND